MTTKSTIIVALLALTQASWMIQSAHAQPADHGKSDRAQKHNRQDERQNPRKHRAERPLTDGSQGMHAPSYSGQIPIGGYFQQQHRDSAHEYYGRQENRGFCPPGLAKKGIAMTDTSKKITGQVLNRIIFCLCDIQKKEEGRSRPSSRTSFKNYFLTGSSGLTSLPGM